MSGAITEHLRQIVRPTGDANQSLRTNLQVDTNIDLFGATVVFALAVWLDSRGGMFYAGLIALVTLLRATAFLHYRRDQITLGLLTVIFGTWALALPGVYLIPQGFPIHVINVVSPLVLAVGFMKSQWVRLLAVLAVIYIILLGSLAFYHQGMVWAELFPDGAFELSIITSLTAVVLLFLLDVRDSNMQMMRNVAQTQAADQAVRESRRRLTTVADAERVRIERNIHDGAQQQLVAMAVTLKLAADQTQDRDHQELLENLHQQTQDAVSELRELAHGVYPAVLAARGLVEALRGVARRSPNQVDVVANGPLPLGETEEVALYFVCLEALQNSAKHAGADSVTTIAFETANDQVQVTIADNGPGFDPTNEVGSRGLLNMSDRIAALGGDFELQSSPGHGTTITAQVPAAADA